MKGCIHANAELQTHVTRRQLVCQRADFPPGLHNTSHKVVGATLISLLSHRSNLHSAWMGTADNRLLERRILYEDLADLHGFLAILELKSAKTVFILVQNSFLRFCLTSC